MHLRSLALCLVPLCLAAQERQESPRAASQESGWGERAGDNGYLVETGTRIPLSMINSVSTKHAAVGDRIYLETVFPIMSDGRIVIPPGSYVAGTVTSVKRPGRVKGRGELYVRFDSLTLPNGVSRDFRARIGSLDGRAGELDNDGRNLEGVTR
jgi:type IV secretory pathway VirB10-like protein